MPDHLTVALAVWTARWICPILDRCRRRSRIRLARAICGAYATCEALYRGFRLRCRIWRKGEISVAFRAIASPSAKLYCHRTGQRSRLLVPHLKIAEFFYRRVVGRHAAVFDPVHGLPANPDDTGQSSLRHGAFPAKRPEAFGDFEFFTRPDFHSLRPCWRLCVPTK